MESHEGDVVGFASGIPVLLNDSLEEVLRYDGDAESGEEHRDVDDRPSDGDLMQKIIKQAEYYFSDENLPSDKFMINMIKANKEGYVPISIISSFRKMKKLTQDVVVIVSALRESSFLVVSSDEKNVKRLHPFRLSEFKDPQLCTVVVENLPEDHSVASIRKIFSDAGRIKSISVRDPHVKKGKSTESLTSCKLHALVEYETVEAAERAAATLNNGDWRNGLRVKLLKRMGKHGNKKQTWREGGPDRDADSTENKQKSTEPGMATVDEEGQVQTSVDKGEQPSRNRVRSKRKNRHGSSSGMGHGQNPLTHATETSKPPPGPKMPDGTRGFTMGRGKPSFPSS